MTLPHDISRCPGMCFPFRPYGRPLPLCSDCLRRTDAPIGARLTWFVNPPIKHDGERYVCDKRIPPTTESKA